MKRLLPSVLLLCPALVHGQTLPVLGGTAVLQLDQGFQYVDFALDGHNFSVSGSATTVGYFVAPFFSVGGQYNLSFGEAFDYNSNVQITIGGAGWGFPIGASGSTQFNLAPFVFNGSTTRPGSVSVPFTLVSDFDVAPFSTSGFEWSFGCNGYCVDWHFPGSGIATINYVPDAFDGGIADLTQIDLTLKVVPTPSTRSLMLLGLGALAGLRRSRPGRCVARA